MQNKWKITLTALVLCSFLLGFGLKGYAYTTADYRNEKTGYSAMIYDGAHLISEEESISVLEAMEPITEYGDVIFATTDSNNHSARDYAKNMITTYANPGSCTVFLIDMSNREIYIYSDGKIRRTLSTDMTDAITDNIYKLATNARYAECAIQAFEQEANLLEGRKVSQSMRWISNLILAFLVSTILMISFARSTHKVEMPDEKELFSGSMKQKLNNTKKVLVKVDRTRHSDSDSSGGGGGGGGGGGSSGGGSGHSF